MSERQLSERTGHFPLVEGRLDNGLRVAISPDRGVPVVAVDLWYAAGAADDPPGRSGAAHLCEHLMFDGSAHVAPGEHQLLLHRAGGVGNATTGYDRTNYFTQAPSGALELVLWLEADRMASAGRVIGPEALDAQVRVIAQEKRQRRAATPGGDDLQAALRGLLPPGHPYRRPPIGSVRDLTAMEPAEISDFHGRHYRPDNAVLSIVGDVDPGEALGLVRRYFDSIERTTGPGTRPRAGLRGSAPARDRVDSSDLTQYVFLLPGDDTTDRQALDAAEVALDVLAGGAYSRLHGRLVRAGLATQVTTSISRLSGVSYGTLTVRSTRPGALAAAEDEIRRLAHSGPTDGELAVALARIEHGWLQRIGNRLGRADELSRLALRAGDPSLLNERLPRLHALSGAHVTRAAATWLDVREPLRSAA